MTHQFGGSWTQEKLRCVTSYLKAYTTALKDQPFSLWYLDAFAGTGQIDYAPVEDEQQTAFPDLEGNDTQGFLQGSIRQALEVEPPFDRYVFVEKSKEKYQKLTEMVERQYRQMTARVQILNRDCNDYLASLADESWNAYGSARRGVLFLDPYGMQVRWSTIQAIARTEAIDVWILFPLGVAVNRLLKRKPPISTAVEQRLDEIFGTHEWFQKFYTKEDDLFVDDQYRKTGNLDAIADFYNERLKLVFKGGVANNPLRLINSSNNPLYLLCFACSNPKPAARNLALKMAQHILKP